MKIIVTWMYSSPIGEQIPHAQIGKSCDTIELQNIYWRSIFLLFESSNRLNRETRHILFVNNPPPIFIDGIIINDLIEQYNIEIIKLPSITKSPLDYYPGWNTQFIVLDILDWLKSHIKKMIMYLFWMVIL